MPALQQTEFGFPAESQGSTLYGGTGIADWEDRPTASNGMGKRMARRRYRTKFGDLMVQAGFQGASADSIDTTAFKQGAYVHISCSNFSDPGFTYAAAVIPGGTIQTTLIDPLCQRIAHLSYGTAVAANTYNYGGVTRNKIGVTLQHEVNQKAKAGAYGSSVAATPAEWKAFNKFFSDRLVAAGCRQHVDLIFVSTSGIDYNTIDVYWDGTIFDEYGCDLYCNMNGSFAWNGSTASFATNLAPALAWARKHGIQKMSFPEFSVGDAHTSVMRQWWIDAANYIKTITDVQMTRILHWGQANHPDQNVNFSAAQDTGSVGTVTQRAHPEQHDGIVQFMSIMGGNEVVTTNPTTPPKPTGLVASSATDGLSINLVWDPVGSPGDRLDFYIQRPGDTFPKKDNPSPLPVTPRSYSFSNNVQPGTPYKVTAVLSDSTTALRSGYATNPDGSLPGVTTSTPGAGNSAPHIVSATATVDGADALHFTLAAVATDPDPGQTLSYSWAVTNTRTGVQVATLTGATAEFHAQTVDPFDAFLSVTDSAASPLTTTQHVAFAVQIGSGYTDNYRLRMLQPNEDVRQMGPIERSTKPTIDDLLWSANHRRSGYNARHRLVGSNYDPGNQAGTTVVTPVAKDFWFTTITMEAETIAHLRTITARAQIGTGALGCFFDPDAGQIFSGVDPFSVDTWLQKAAGVIDMDPPQLITGFNPGDKAIFGWWWPPTGTISQYPQFRVRPAGGMQGFIPSLGISIWGSYANLTSFPTQLDLTAAIIQPEIFLGAPEP